MIFIGDIHGQWNYYTGLVKNITHTPTVQVGDFGLGFPGLREPPHVEGDHWFIRGNHDDPEACRRAPKYLGDYGYKKEWDMFFVGGAESIDKHLRTEGVTWWRDEELDYTTLNTKVIPLYEATKPRIMVTHTCPMSIRCDILGGARDYGRGPDMTERALQVMLDIHAPDIWFFGHWHRHVEVRKNGCRLICLNTYQMMEIEGAEIV